MFVFFGLPEYPELMPDDILFAYCSGAGSQGEKVNYIITYTGAVYRVGIFEFGSSKFMERVCPFLKNLDYCTMPDTEHMPNPDSQYVFERNDWCWLGLCGVHSLYIHASMAVDFAFATQEFNSSEMSTQWLDVAVSLVHKMIDGINPIKKSIMFENTDLNRFIEAQDVPYFCGYKQALDEIKNGRKVNHWIWYIFPQLRRLGRSSLAYYYGIADKNEAQRFLEHPILGVRIREITQALLNHKDKTVLSIFGDIDAVKVQSCMTMFDSVAPNDIFNEALYLFYNGRRCEQTLKFIQIN